MSEDSFVRIAVAALSAIAVILAAAIPAAFIAMSKLKAAAADAAAARTASERAESSMNNSPHTVTERLASIMTAQREHTKDIQGVREDIGILQKADRTLRADLTDHLETSAKVVRTVNDTAATLEKILPDIERLTKTPTT